MDPQGHRPTRTRTRGRSSSGWARDLGMVEVAELVEDRERRRLQRNGARGRRERDEEGAWARRRNRELAFLRHGRPDRGDEDPPLRQLGRDRVTLDRKSRMGCAGNDDAPDRHLRLRQPARDLPVRPARGRAPRSGRDGARLRGDRQHPERGREQHGAGRPRAGPAGPARGGRARRYARAHQVLPEDPGWPCGLLNTSRPNGLSPGWAA